MPTRRAFMKNSALAMFGIGAAPSWLARSVYAGETGPAKQKKVMVTIFQRGAADGLNIVAPHGEKAYYSLRPSIAVPREMALDLDGFFGFHPSLQALKPIFDAKQLAVIEAAGSPDPTRSHFDAQDYMESGTPGLKATNDGWLNRALRAEPHPSPVRAISLGPNMARTLKGRNAAIALADIKNFSVRDATSAGAFESMYETSSDTVLHGAGQETFEAVKLLQSLQKQPYAPAAGVKYPGSRLGQSLQQIAQLIKADVGMEVAFADVGGWDMHVNETGQNAKQGQLANLLTDYGNSLAAFYQDMGDRMQNVVLVTMSEFGRTARENGNRGTDHGHANVMFAMGGPVAGGKVYGDWPGLETEQLYEGRDLNLTTDFRAVLGEVVSGHLGNHDLKRVFPNYQGDSSKFRGILKAA